MSNSTRIKDLLQTSTIADDSVFVVDGNTGTKNIKFTDLFSSLINQETKYNMGNETVLSAINKLYNYYQDLEARYTISDNAGAHNSLFRGRNLGSTFTAAMSSSIQNGTFKDIFVGDYFIMGGVIYRVAGCNLLDKTTYGNNLCLVADTTVGTAKMNNSDTTSGGYADSIMRSTNISSIKSKIISAFNQSHVITYTDNLTNTVSNGKVAAATSKSCTVELMSESMIFGTNNWSTSGHEAGSINSQFPLFALAPEYKFISADYWLRNVVDASKFEIVNRSGIPISSNASATLGIRPFFFIK